jgi:plasmid stability protein
MVDLNIRDFDPEIWRRLAERAARSGRSVEEEARRILTAAVAVNAAPTDLVALFRETFGPRHGIDLALPERSEFPRDPLV